MNLSNFIKDISEKFINLFDKKFDFHNYKYCTSINISRNVSDIIRQNEINKVQEKINLLEKIY